MAALPTGIVTFLKTDIEKSTRFAQRQEVFDRHDAIVRAIASQHKGLQFYDGGDGFGFVFPDGAQDALAAAEEIQERLYQEDWGDIGQVKVRMAVHSGEARLRADGTAYAYLPALLVLARIMEVAHGQQVLLTQATAELAGLEQPRRGRALRSLGEHHLRSVGKIALLQLDYHGMPPSFPPIRSLDYLPTNLPPNETSFIGREQESEEIRRRLLTSRLLTLIGAGGSGKTRLATQAADLLLSRYPDGIWFVDLTPLPKDASDDEIAKCILLAAQLRADPGHDLLAALIAKLRDSKMLLILDNCEHVVRSCGRVAAGILANSKQISLLATSRIPLGVAGEERLRVRELELPSGEVASLTDYLAYDAVRLFVERGEAADPEFVLTRDNAAVVARICAQLSGIPLALELASARLDSFGVEEIAEHLHSLLQIPAEGAGTGRFPTMCAAIQWSYDLLRSEEERGLFRQLAVFRGGWFLDAVQSICAESGLSPTAALATLEALCRASLVVAENVNARKRYRLLEPIREFAQERLDEADEGEAARERHFDFFAHLARQAETHLTGKEQQNWLARLECDHDNLRTALASAPSSQARLEMAARLWRFWHKRGHLTEGRAWLTNALGRAAGGELSVRSQALFGLGVLTTWQNAYAEAEQRLQQALALREQARDVDGCAEVLLALGNLRLTQAQYEEARRLYTESLTLREETHNRWGVAAAQMNLGIVCRQLAMRDPLNPDMAELDVAEDCFRQAYDLYVELEDETNQAVGLSNIGVIQTSRKQHAEARRYYEQSHQVFARLRIPDGSARNLLNIGISFLTEARHSEAYDYLRESLRLWHQLGDRNDCLLVLARFVPVWLALGWSEKVVLISYFLDSALADRQEVVPGNALEAVQESRRRAESQLALPAIAMLRNEGANMTLADAVECALHEEAERAVYSVVWERENRERRVGSNPPVA